MVKKVYKVYNIPTCLIKDSKYYIDSLNEINNSDYEFHHESCVCDECSQYDTQDEYNKAMRNNEINNLICDIVYDYELSIIGVLDEKYEDFHLKIINNNEILCIGFPLEEIEINKEVENISELYNDNGNNNKVLEVIKTVFPDIDLTIDYLNKNHCFKFIKNQIY